MGIFVKSIKLYTHYIYISNIDIVYFSTIFVPLLLTQLFKK